VNLHEPSLSGGPAFSINREPFVALKLFDGGSQSKIGSIIGVARIVSQVVQPFAVACHDVTRLKEPDPRGDFSVTPFHLTRVNERRDGNLHLPVLHPEFHGRPVEPHFGWRLVERLATQP